MPGGRYVATVLNVVTASAIPLRYIARRITFSYSKLFYVKQLKTFDYICPESACNSGRVLLRLSSLNSQSITEREEGFDRVRIFRFRTISYSRHGLFPLFCLYRKRGGRPPFRRASRFAVRRALFRFPCFCVLCMIGSVSSGFW